MRRLGLIGLAAADLVVELGEARSARFTERWLGGGWSVACATGPRLGSER